MDAQEPNPGRLAPREELRRQRRSVFMTALIGATLTAVLAGAAAFRIHDTGSGGNVNIVTTTSTTLPDTTTDTAGEDTNTTLYVPPGVPASDLTDPTTTTVVTTATSATTTSTSTSTTTTAAGPPPTNGPPPAARMSWSVTPQSATLQSGAKTGVTITAHNVGNAAGNVNVPGCPSTPSHFSRGMPFAGSCHPGASVVTLGAGQSAQWSDTVYATSDATIHGTPLAPGNYSVGVSGSPLLLFVLHVTA